METCHKFKDIKTFEKFLRTKKYKDGELDYVTVGGKVYTMHEYDHDGRYIDWGHKKSDTLIRVETQNRYGSVGFKDAEVFLFENWGLWRNDISYYE